MSVFKRPGEETYSYRFRVNGRGFSGQTGLKDKRSAERFERDEKENKKARILDPEAEMTFNLAASRYWLEHGQYKANPKDTRRQIGWLERKIGPHTKLVDITDSMVALMMAERRGEKVRGKALKNASVNRSVLNPLRRIIGRADKVWKKPIPNINWAAHTLPEPKERVREATLEEQEAIYESIRPDYVPAIVFAFLTGCRLAEITGLKWDHINWFSREITIFGKGDSIDTIPMTESVHDLLWEIRNNHESQVFTYVATRTQHGRIKGNIYPITYNGLKTIWRRAKAYSGVKDFRFHDMRHTAATRLLRATGNIRLAQKLLRHKDISTTTKYAHVNMDDLRKGMDEVERSELHKKLHKSQ